MRGQLHAPAALYPGKDRVPTVQEAGWAPGPVWTGAEILALTGIRSPDRQARSQSLYRLSYPAHYMPYTAVIMWLSHLLVRMCCSSIVTLCGGRVDGEGNTQLFLSYLELYCTSTVLRLYV